MKHDVVAFYIKDASLVAKRRLSRLKQKGSLRDYMKEFIASKCKGKEKVPEPRLNARERNAQKDEEDVDHMEHDVVASYTKDASLVTK